MWNAVLLCLLAVPVFLAGILFLLGKEQVLFLKSEMPHKPIRVGERLVIGFTFSFVGLLLLATVYSMFILGDPYRLLHKIFGLIR